MNRLLNRQIKRHLGGIENVPESMMSFLEAIDRSYKHYEEDRLLLERSMEISSRELEESNEQIREEAKRQKEILQRLKESLNTLMSVDAENDTPTDYISDEDDVLKVLDFIEIQSKHIKRVESEVFRVQHFINQSNDAIQVMDSNCRLVFANDNAMRWMEVNREDSYGNNILDFDSKFEAGIDWKARISQLEFGETLTLERVQSNSKGKFPVEVILKRVRLEDGKYVICVARDISGRKEAEKQRESLIDRLTKVNEELENFAYIVSHDLKAPIRGIGSISDWLKEDYGHLLDDEGNNLLDLMKRRVLRMQQLIEGILQYSRVGRGNVEKVDLDLNTLLDEVVDTIASGLTENNFELVIPEKLPHIHFAETSTRQVFQNLISNAIKYNDKEKCIVTITAKDLQGEYWQFEVKDNGPGIKPNYHEKIFKIFQTLQARDKFESTGIGLSIIKKIVEQANGRIWIESDVGKGCSFIFTLPKNH